MFFKQFHRFLKVKQHVYHLVGRECAIDRRKVVLLSPNNTPFEFYSSGAEGSPIFSPRVFTKITDVWTVQRFFFVNQRFCHPWHQFQFHIRGEWAAWQIKTLGSSHLDCCFETTECIILKSRVGFPHFSHGFFFEVITSRFFWLFFKNLGYNLGFRFF